MHGINVPHPVHHAPPRLINLPQMNPVRECACVQICIYLQSRVDEVGFAKVCFPRSLASCSLPLGWLFSCTRHGSPQQFVCLAPSS